MAQGEALQQHAGGNGCVECTMRNDSAAAGQKAAHQLFTGPWSVVSRTRLKSSDSASVLPPPMPARAIPKGSKERPSTTPTAHSYMHNCTQLYTT